MGLFGSFDRELEEAARDRDREVQKEAARLIKEEGMALWEAMGVAARNVKLRRKQATKIAELDNRG